MQKSNKKELLILIFFSALLIIPSIFLRDYTPENELKYINIAQNMVHSGQYFLLNDNGLLYADKPPFFFWMINGLAHVFGGYSLGIIGLFLTFIPALLIAVAAWYFSSIYIDKKWAMVTPLTLMTLPLFFISAACIRMDMMMNLAITASLVLFYLIYDNKIKKTKLSVYMIYILMGIGIYIKGPAGIIVPLLVIIVFLAFEKRMDYLKEILFFQGLGIIFLMMLFWLIPAGISGGSKYIDMLLIKETFGRTINAVEHRRAFYYYLTILPGLLLQWFFFAAAAGLYYWKKRKHLQSFEKFLLIWSLGTLVFFSIVSSKLWIYILPMAFPTSILLINYIYNGIKKNSKLIRKGTIFGLSVFLLIGIATIIMGGKIIHNFVVNDFIIGGIVLSIVSILGIVFEMKEKKKEAVIIVSVAYLILILAITSLIPKYNYLIGLKDISTQITNTSQYKGGEKLVSFKFSAGVYAKYFVKKDITYCPGSDEMRVLVEKEGKILTIVQAEDLKKLPKDLNYQTVYTSSNYSLIAVSREN